MRQTICQFSFMFLIVYKSGGYGKVLFQAQCPVHHLGKRNMCYLEMLGNRAQESLRGTFVDIGSGIFNCRFASGQRERSDMTGHESSNFIRQCAPRRSGTITDVMPAKPPRRGGKRQARACHGVTAEQFCRVIGSERETCRAVLFIADEETLGRIPCSNAPAHHRHSTTAPWNRTKPGRPWS